MKKIKKIEPRKKSKTVINSKTKKAFKINPILKFKNLLSQKIGNINWMKLGTYSLMVFILVGASGVFGPKIQLAAVKIIKTALLV